MKKVLLFMAILYAFNGVSQTNKTVIGTFATGCQVFNFEFQITTNGLYSFRINSLSEQIFVEPNLLESTEKNLGIISDSLNKWVSDQPSNTDFSSALSTNANLITQIKGIRDGTNDITFWKNNKEQVKSVISETKRGKLIDYEINIANKLEFEPSIFNLISKLEIIIKSVETIAITKEYVLNDFQQESFVQLCDSILSKSQIFFLEGCTETPNLENVATAIFYQIKAKMELNDDEPKTAVLKLKSQYVNCYYSKKGSITNSQAKGELIKNRFIVDNVAVEFEDGTMKNIFADLFITDVYGKKISLNTVRFKNVTPISISNKNDVDRFGDYVLYVTDFAQLRTQISLEKENTPGSSALILSERKSSKETLKADQKDSLEKIYLILSDLIDYNAILEVNKEDYSPVNSVVTLNEKNPTQELKKEKRSQILNVKSYTDLMGVEGDQPNGLIQLEVSRKFNLWTMRTGTKGSYFGVFTYIEPKLASTKIEENNNRLVFKKSDIDTSYISLNRKVITANSLDLLRYQSSVFDLDLNLIKWNVPAVKSNLQANLSFGMLRTKVTDSLRVDSTGIFTSTLPNDATLNTFKYGFSLIYELKPDGRYGLSIGYDFRSYNLLNNNYQIPYLQSVNAVNSFWVDAFLKMNEESTLFFKYKVSFVRPAIDHNFVQIQLGYSRNLFKSTN